MALSVSLRETRRLSFRYPTRIVRSQPSSMRSTTTFDKQPLAYRLFVLPPKIRRVAVEAAASDFWRKYVGLSGAVVGLSHFGESAAAEVLYEEFGITVSAMVSAVCSTLEVEPDIVD